MYFFSVSTNIRHIKTGVDDIDSKRGISLYPNPTTGSFTLDIRAQPDLIYSISVFNNLGQVIYRTTLYKNNAIITLPGSIPSGNYVLRLTSNDRSEVLRFTLTR